MLQLMCHSQQTQLKALETKLEHIAQTLSTKANDNITDVPSSSTSASNHARQPLDPESSAMSQSVRNTYSPAETMTSITMTGSAHGYEHSQPASTKMDTPENDMLLDRYQRLMAPHMPFVRLPMLSTAQALQDEDPLLLQAITTVAGFHNTDRQQIMGKDFVRKLCDRLLVHGEKTLQLLQAILIFSNWYNPHLYMPRNSTNILHLAMALVSDLALDRGPREKAPVYATMKAYGISRPDKVLSNDERRAVLGTFYLTSSLFASFSKVDIMQWTPWLAECCTALVEVREYESDTEVVQLVQMQRIMQEAMAAEHSSAPIQLYAKSFLGELVGLGNERLYGAPKIVQQLQGACTKVAIWERAFVGLTSGQTALSAPRPRLDGMWCCMEAVKAFLNVFMTLPVEAYPTVPFTVFGQFAYVFVIVVRAFSMHLEGWDAQALGNLIDFSAIMNDAADRYGSVSSSVVDGLNIKNEAFANIAAKLRWAKSIHETRLASHASAMSIGQTAGTTVAQAPGSMQHLPTPPDAASDPLGLMDLDLWSGLEDPSHLWTEFDTNLVGL